MTDDGNRISKGNNTIFTVPWIDHDITANEIHAATIGTVGILLGYLYAALMVEYALMLIIALVGYSLIGKPAFHSLPHDVEEYESSIGLKTIKHEPWWFLATMIASTLIGLHLGGLV